MDNLLDMIKGKVFDVIESRRTFEGYNPYFDPFHDHLVDLLRKFLWITSFANTFDFLMHVINFGEISVLLHLLL